MAAAEYYGHPAGTQLPSHQNPYPPQPASQYQYPQQPPYQGEQNALPPSQPPPAYSVYPQKYPQDGPSPAPYPGSQSMEPQYFPPPPQQNPQNGYLAAPIQHHRSHSQPSRPARVRFEDELYDSDSADGRSNPSDSDYSSPRRRHRRRHRRSRSHDRSLSRSLSPDRERRHHSRHHESRSHRKDKDRNTFLGAGVGGLIGDAIVPGLGTAAGIILGGYGGRKHTKRRTRSDAADDRYNSRHGRAHSNAEEERYYPHRGRAQGDSGWDEESATFRKGHAVR